MKLEHTPGLDPNLEGASAEAQEIERQTGEAPAGTKKQKIRQPNQNNSVMTGQETEGRTFVHEPNRNLHGQDGELHPEVVAAGTSGLPDPIEPVDRQRKESMSGAGDKQQPTEK